MVDIARLAYEVDSSQLVQGTAALEKHTSSASRTQNATEKLERSAVKNTKAFSGLSKSERELQFAARGLPAQFTDIFTSLQAGQNPMQVLIQQGGQVKDTFGGIGPAARAMGGYVAGLVTPLTLAAAGATALGVAIYQGAQEFNAYNQALAKTGEFTGYTAVELAALAKEMDNIAGVTEGGAAAALAKVAGSGRLAGENLEMATRAALTWSEATGESADTVIEKFVEIGKEPVEALLKLNETEHFLTQTQIDRIRTLEEEGRAQEAVAEGARIYSEVVIDRAGEVKKNLGYLERAWHAITGKAGEAWDAMLGVGRAQTRSPDAIRSEIEELANATYEGWRDAQLKFRRQSLDPKEMMLLPDIDEAAFAKSIKARRERLRTELANADGFIKFYDGSEPVILTQREEERAALREQWASDDLSALNDKKRLETELNAIEAEGVRLGLERAEIEKQKADVRAKYAEKAKESGRASIDRIAEEERAVNRLLEKYTRKTEAQSRQIALIGRTGEADKVAYDIQRSGIMKVDAALAGLALSQAMIIDGSKTLGEQFDNLTAYTIGKFKESSEAAGESFDQMSEFARQAGRNMQDAFADFLYDPFSDGLDGMLKGFGDMLRKMAAQAAAAAIFESIGSYGKANGGTWWGQLIGAFFSGGREYGGSVYSGGMYQTGERNKPELLTTPNGQYLIPGDNGRVDPIRAAAPAPSMRSGYGNVYIYNQGGQARTEERPSNDGSGMKDLLVFIESTARNAIGSDLARGTGVAKVGQQAYGWQRQGAARG